MADRFGATIIRKNGLDELYEIYERYPEYRGKTPNRLVNLAWEHFVVELLKKAKSNNEQSESQRVGPVVSQVIYACLVRRAVYA